MKHSVKILASVCLMAGLAIGIGISYSGYTNPDPEESYARFHDCPAYATAQPIFEARSGQNWAKAGRLAEMGGQAPEGMLADNLPIKNFIDEHIFGKMEQDQIPHANLCTDGEFMRRVYLDLAGRIPTPAEAKSFLASTNTDKRDRLIEQLLDSPEYVDRMALWFGDLFQVTYGGFFGAAGGLYFGRTAFNGYIRQFLEENRPYNELVTDMITAQGDNWEETGAPANFLARAWENMANTYDVLDNAAAQVGKMFLGVPTLCISCHSGARHLEPVNTYLSQKTRRDLWGLSAFFSGVTFQRAQRGGRGVVAYIFDEGPSQGYDVNSPLGRNGVRPQRLPGPDDPIVQPRYFFTNTNASSSDSMKWRAELAGIVTRDPQFAKATMNYLWKEFFVMGIVDPPDAFDLARTDQATNPELLEALGKEFVASGYDLKYMIELMVKSTAYQLSAQFPGEWQGSYAQYFARHFVRRMPAEMVLDAIVQSSGKSNPYYVEVQAGEVQEFQRAMQLPDTSEPRQVQGGAITQPQAAANTASRNLMNLFFRGDRMGNPRRPDGSILQALAMTNNALVLSRIGHADGGLVDRLVNDTTLTTAQIADELFLATVSRYPTAQERTAAIAVLDANRNTGAENLYLGLLNKLDFIIY